jgi:hypothetical protein
MANNAAIKSNDIFAIFCAGSVAMKKVITEDLEGETGLQTLKNRSTRMPETWRCNLERAEKKKSKIVSGDDWGHHFGSCGCSWDCDNKFSEDLLARSLEMISGACWKDKFLLIASKLEVTLPKRNRGGEGHRRGIAVRGGKKVSVKYFMYQPDGNKCLRIQVSVYLSLLVPLLLFFSNRILTIYFIVFTGVPDHVQARARRWSPSHEQGCTVEAQWCWGCA